MIKKIQKFYQGPSGLRTRLNEIVDAVNRLSNIKGDGLVQVRQNQNGVSFKLGTDRVGERLGNRTSSSTSTSSQFAKITQSLVYGEPAGGGLSTYVVKLVNSSFAVTGDEITIDHVFGYSAVQDMRDWSPWFAEDQIVKVTVSLVTGSSLYYFADTLTYLGDEADASLRFDEDDFRLKAVWQ